MIDIRLISAALAFLQRPTTVINGTEAPTFVAVCKLLQDIAGGKYKIEEKSDGNVRPALRFEPGTFNGVSRIGERQFWAGEQPAGSNGQSGPVQPEHPADGAAHQRD